VFGDTIQKPGTYLLDGNQTVLQALATAGSGEISEVVVVRTKGALGPVLPGQDPTSDVIRVNLRDLERNVEGGSLIGNVELQDGDTLFVPRVDPMTIRVIGEVRREGSYGIATNTTVLQGIALAGGLGERAAIGRATITRLSGGKVSVLHARMDD